MRCCINKTVSISSDPFAPGVDNLGRAWNDETMILHLKVYEVSAFTVTPSILDNFSKQLEFEGEVKATKDVRLYGKAVE